MTFAGSSSDTAGAHSASLVGTNTSGSGSGSGSEYSPHLDEIDRGGYNPPYAVRKRTPRIVAVVNAAAVMTETEVAEADRPCLLNHASPSTISSASKGKTRLNHLGPDVDDTGLIEDADLIAPAPTLSEPFTVTFAAALASPLPLPFDRRRMELVVAWSSPQGLWQYVPLAQYVPSWGLHFGGTRMRIQDEGDGHGFEVRDLVREFVGCIPVVGRFAAWL
jgi:hypothetical protein